MIEKKVLYFEKPGPENTDACIEKVREEVENNGYRYVVVASSSGETGIRLAEALKGFETELFVVKYATTAKDQSDELDADVRKRLADNRATFFSSPAIKLSMDAAFGLKLAPIGPSKIVDATLRAFGEGLKVCCEIVMMATDKGLLTEGMEVLSVAGTQSGADTVVVVRATASMRLQELRVKEILAKPRG